MVFPLTGSAVLRTALTDEEENADPNINDYNGIDTGTKGQRFGLLANKFERPLEENADPNMKDYNGIDTGTHRPRRPRFGSFANGFERPLGPSAAQELESINKALIESSGETPHPFLCERQRQLQGATSGLLVSRRRPTARSARSRLPYGKFEHCCLNATPETYISIVQQGLDYMSQCSSTSGMAWKYYKAVIALLKEMESKYDGIDIWDEVLRKVFSCNATQHTIMDETRDFFQQLLFLKVISHWAMDPYVVRNSFRLSPSFLEVFPISKFLAETLPGSSFEEIQDEWDQRSFDRITDYDKFTSKVGEYLSSRQDERKRHIVVWHSSVSFIMSHLHSSDDVDETKDRLGPFYDQNGWLENVSPYALAYILSKRAKLTERAVKPSENPSTTIESCGDGEMETPALGTEEVSPGLAVLPSEIDTMKAQEECSQPSYLGQILSGLSGYFKGSEF
ncbi:MAG: hypothetical protein SGARI_001933 [Bacillariaceae sp.]